MLSVIIPTYNRAPFLEKSIGSVFNQTLGCDELIVIDDGSTDDTYDLIQTLKKHAHTPLRYEYQENRGAAAARNLGIDVAKGEILCFLDSDDCFQPDKLKVQFEEMQKKPQYSISHTREIWYRRGHLLQQKKKHSPPHGDIYERCLRMCVVGMSTVMVKKTLFLQYGNFDENLPCCEDYDFWLRVSPFENFLLIDEPLTIKDGGRPDQLSTQYRMGMDKFRIRSLCKLLDTTELSQDQSMLAFKELVYKCNIYGNGCIKYGKIEEGSQILAIPDKYSTIIIS